MDLKYQLMKTPHISKMRKLRPLIYKIIEHKKQMMQMQKSLLVRQDLHRVQSNDAAALSCGDIGLSEGWIQNVLWCMSCHLS